MIYMIYFRHGSQDTYINQRFLLKSGATVYLLCQATTRNGRYALRAIKNRATYKNTCTFASTSNISEHIFG